jgi:hypothetical protein
MKSSAARAGRRGAHEVLLPGLIDAIQASSGVRDGSRVDRLQGRAGLDYWRALAGRILAFRDDEVGARSRASRSRQPRTGSGVAAPRVSFAVGRAWSNGRRARRPAR